MDHDELQVCLRDHPPPMGFATPGHSSPPHPMVRALLIPRPLVDALAGAVGELGQILTLYPVEAIKVRCQQDGISAAQVMAQLGKTAAQPGGPARVAAMLYSGIGPSAVFSIAVGAVHCK